MTVFSGPWNRTPVETSLLDHVTAEWTNYVYVAVAPPLAVRVLLSSGRERSRQGPLRSYPEPLTNPLTNVSGSCKRVNHAATGAHGKMADGS